MRLRIPRLSVRQRLTLRIAVLATLAWWLVTAAIAVTWRGWVFSAGLFAGVLTYLEFRELMHTKPGDDS